MFLPKVVYAQIADICYERERRGEPAYEMRRGSEQIRSIPTGSICFAPDLHLSEGDPVPQFARIQNEPVLIATDDVNSFVYLDAAYTDIQMFDLEEGMSPNCIHEGRNDYYVLVVHGLNFLFSDGSTSSSPPWAKPLTPPPAPRPVPKTSIRIDGDTVTKVPVRSKTNLPFL